MQHVTNEVVLRMYRLTQQIQLEVNHGGSPLASDKELRRIMSNLIWLVPLIDDEIQNPSPHDVGRVQGFVRYAQYLIEHLERLERTPLISGLVFKATDAKAAGQEAWDIYSAGQPADAEVSEENDGVAARSLHEILEDLRGSVVGSNELSDEQKKDALGYVDALIAISNMASPDKKLFEEIVARMSKFGEKAGSFLLVEAAKELIKFGVKSLFG
jgi:hypothetical protein